MAISVNYRGEIKSKEANATVQWLKQNNKISFVEWCPTGFKIGLNEVPAAALDDDIMAKAKRNVTMIGGKMEAKAEAETTLSEQTEVKKDTTKELWATLKYIDSLHQECDWLMKFFDVRKTQGQA